MKKNTIYFLIVLMTVSFVVQAKGLFQELIPGQNQRGNQRINLIFDCRGMTVAENAVCLKKIPWILSLDTDHVFFYSKSGLKKAGLFQIEPFKSNADHFNFWFVQRTQDNPAEGRCGSDPLAEHVPFSNAILVSLCNMNSMPSHATLLLNVLHNKNRKNAKVIGEIFMTARNGAVPPVMAYNFDHEMGHALGGLSDEDKKQGGFFPNCAPSMEAANRWWKKTGLVPQNVQFVQGCKDNASVIAYDNTIMKGGGFNTSDVAVEDYYSPVHKYWICKNIFDLTGAVQGACRHFEKFGLDRPLYSP